MGYPGVIIVVMTYLGGFSTSKNGSFLALSSYANLLDTKFTIHLYINCYMVVIWTVMAVKIFLFQAYSNLIRHLQLESCKMGKLPVQRKERKIKHTQIALLLLHLLH